MLRQVGLAMCIGALMFGAAACDDDDDNDINQNPGGDTNTADTLRDPQIMAVTAAVNQGEIDQANAALPKLTDDDAREYAEHMIADHSAAQANQNALGIAPEENELSATIKAKGAAVLQQLQAGTASNAYDRLYMQSQVDGHTDALNAMNQTLIPSADTDQVREYLRDLREHVSDHLEDARDELEDLPTTP